MRGCADFSCRSAATVDVQLPNPTIRLVADRYRDKRFYVNKSRWLDLAYMLMGAHSLAFHASPTRQAHNQHVVLRLSNCIATLIVLALRVVLFAFQLQRVLALHLKESANPFLDSGQCNIRRATMIKSCFSATTGRLSRRSYKSCLCV